MNPVEETESTILERLRHFDGYGIHKLPIDPVTLKAIRDNKYNRKFCGERDDCPNSRLSPWRKSAVKEAKVLRTRTLIFCPVTLEMDIYTLQTTQRYRVRTLEMIVTTGYSD